MAATSTAMIIGMPIAMPAKIFGLLNTVADDFDLDGALLVGPGRLRWIKVPSAPRPRLTPRPIDWPADPVSLPRAGSAWSAAGPTAGNFAFEGAAATGPGAARLGRGVDTITPCGVVLTVAASAEGDIDSAAVRVGTV